MSPPKRNRPTGASGGAAGGATNENESVQLAAEDTAPLHRPQHPPEFVPLKHVRAATEAEVAEVRRCYNGAVYLWNRQERDLDQPLPRHLDHGRWSFSLGFTRRTRGVVAHRNDGVAIFLRTRNWAPFHGGWSCCRTMLAPVDILRGEVHVPRMTRGGGHDE